VSHELYTTCPHGRGWGACGECRIDPVAASDTRRPVPAPEAPAETIDRLTRERDEARATLAHLAWGIARDLGLLPHPSEEPKP